MPQSATFGHDESVPAEQNVKGRSKRRCRQHHHHIIVEHHYHDHAHDPYERYQGEQHPAKGGVTIPFPIKLHAMLVGVKREGLEDVCSWQPHGRCFVVRKPQEFVELLPRYFKLTKLASFQRQLNLYGFQRLTRGKDRGAYYHELFLRGKPFLAHHIERMKVKGTGVRARSNPEQEPDFWTMEWMAEGNESAGALTPQPVPAVQSNVDCENTTETPIMSSFIYPGAFPSFPTSTSCSSTQYVPVVSPPTMGKPKVSPDVSTSNSFFTGDDDRVSAFDKSFHYMDPFQPLPLEDSAPVPSLEQVPSQTAEAERFFQDFDFPEAFFSSDIEDDRVFGEMLESLIA